jgi:phage repressor protein C with HTH and peptisase S24 domain
LGDSLMRSYLAGSDPGRLNVEKIWKGSGCSIVWLMTGQGPMYEPDPTQIGTKAKTPAYRYRRRSTDAAATVSEPGAIQHEEPEVLESSDGREFVLVPRYDVRVSAGGGSVIHSEQIVDHLSFQYDWFEREVGISPKNAVVVEVRGDSMVPDLHDGELVIIDTSQNVFVDDAIYVLHYGDAIRIKKVLKRIDGSVEIKSSNERYGSEMLTPEQAQQVVIIGRAKRAIPRVRRLP